MSGVLVVVTVAINPGVAIAIVLLAALFVPLERLFGLRRQPVLRVGWRTDVVHFFVNNVLAFALLVVGIVTIAVPLRALTPVRWRETIAGMGAPAQFALAMVVAELTHYWAHRMAHRIPRLWRFHKVHHSIVQMDWLAAARLHPIDQALTQLASVAPLFALGVTPETFGAYVAISTLQAIFVHSNVRFRFGPLRYLIMTPQFHHWHHGNTADAYNTNFAGQLPLIDKLFGTLHLPKRQWPARYGVDDALPSGYLAQMAWPFAAARLRRSAEARPRRGALTLSLQLETTVRARSDST